MTSTCQTITVADEGYEALKAALETFNEENTKKEAEDYEQFLAQAREDKEMRREISGSEYFEGYSSDTFLYPWRADSAVVSLVKESSSYLGGAHPNHYGKGVTFDTESGKRLSITDVVTDMDRLKTMVTEYLEKEVGDGLFPEYKETLDAMFANPEGNEPLEWVLDTEGLTVLFNPYAVAPYAAGTIAVPVSYAEHKDMFCEKYSYQSSGFARRLNAWDSIETDLNGDKKKETLTMTVQDNPEKYTSLLELTREGADGKTTFSEEYYGDFKGAYLLKTEDGRSYLYAEYVSENDWRRLEVFDLADKKGTGETITHVGTSDDSLYDGFIQTPDHFLLYNRVDALGTYQAYLPYHVGRDGMPKADGDVYTRVPYEEEKNWDDTYKFTVKLPLKVTVYRQNGETAEETLPEGTEISPVRTDKKTFVEGRLKDGTLCEIPLEQKPGEFGFFINGISEWDCFEGLGYAG